MAFTVRKAAKVNKLRIALGGRAGGKGGNQVHPDPSQPNSAGQSQPQGSLTSPASVAGGAGTLDGGVANAAGDDEDEEMLVEETDLVEVLGLLRQMKKEQTEIRKEQTVMIKEQTEIRQKVGEAKSDFADLKSKQTEIRQYVGVIKEEQAELKARGDSACCTLA